MVFATIFWKNLKWGTVPTEKHRLPMLPKSRVTKWNSSKKPVSLLFATTGSAIGLPAVWCFRFITLPAVWLHLAAAFWKMIRKQPNISTRRSLKFTTKARCFTEFSRRSVKWPGPINVIWLKVTPMYFRCTRQELLMWWLLPERHSHLSKSGWWNGLPPTLPLFTMAMKLA